jgi:TolB-like protein/tetratricopeptide (TPR) repeat protein
MTLARDGSAVSLGGRGAALLSALVDAGGGIVSREALMQAAWPGRLVEDANLTVQIAALRRILGNGSHDEGWIVTVPRGGYRLQWREGHRGQRGRGAPSLAVLPFENLSGDAEQGFLADGLVDEIITALSRFRTFAVVARSSTFAYRGRAIDVREVARELGVGYLLQGSVRRHGGRLRVTAQLIDGTSGAHVWAERFDGSAADIFDFQDEITRAVVGLIEPQIHRAEIERARRKHPESLDAWDLYVEAVPLVYAADVPGYSQAIDLLDRALALDPAYVPALAFASWAHEKRATFGGPTCAAADDREVALDRATRALELDPDDALAMALLGWERILFRSDYDGLGLCVRAVELNPNHRAVLDLAAVAHINAGDLADATACAMRALQLSPGATDAYMCMNHISAVYFAAGDFVEAAEWAQRSIALERNFLFSQLFLAASLAHLGRVEAAGSAMRSALAIRPDYTVANELECRLRFPERWQLWIEGLRLAGMPEN